jgi:hypothetical protein
MHNQPNLLAVMTYRYNELLGKILSGSSQGGFREKGFVEGNVKYVFLAR